MKNINYYALKQKANQIIDKFVSQGKWAKEEIIFMTVRDCGVSKKSVDEFIEMGIDAGAYRIHDKTKIMIPTTLTDTKQYEEEFTTIVGDEKKEVN